MAREKYRVGETVEMLCHHVRDGQPRLDWLPGRVIQVDQRMVAIQFDAEVYSNNGWLIPDRTLWCTHGSRHVRRLGSDEPQAGADGSS